MSFFADVSSEMVYPLLPLFVVGVLGSSKTALGAVEGSAVFIVAIMTAFAGWRSDRMGRRVPWIRFGYGLPVLGKTIIALATVWPMVLGGRLLDRFGKGLRSSPRDALIADAVSPNQRGRAFGLHRAFDTAGALLGVLLSALLLWWLTGSPRNGAATDGTEQAWAYRTILGVGAALGLASLVLTFLVRESEPVPISSRLEAPDGGAPPPVNDVMADGWMGLPVPYWTVLGMLLLFAAANSSDTFLLLRASDLGLAPWAVVLAYALFNLVYAAVSYPAGALSDRIGRWRVIAVGWFVYVVVYLGFAVANAAGVWLLMALYGVSIGLTDGVGKALIADVAPQARRGTAMGLFYGATGITTLGSSLIAGLAWDRLGPHAPFLIGGICAALALAALPIGRKWALRGRGSGVRSA